MDTRKAGPFMAYFWGFGAFALFVPLLVPFYEDLGFSGAQIGVLAGLPPVVSAFGAPLWTSIADRTGRHMRIWVSLVIAGALLTALIATVDTFWAVLGLLLLFNVAMSPFVSFIDTATMHMLGDEKALYGRIRLGATLGFATLAWIGGVVAGAYGITASMYAAAAVFLVAIVFVSRLEFGDPEPTEAGEAVGLIEMLREPRWLVFATIGVAGGIGFTLSAGFFYPFMEGVGAAEATIGLAIFVGTISEVPVLFWGNRFLSATRPFVLLVSAVAFTGVRFVLMSFAGSVGMIMFWQLSFGLTFVLMWVAAVAYADKHAPAGRKTSAQGLFAAASTGVGAAIGGFGAGPILSNWGADAVYLVGGIAITAIAAAGWVAGVRVERSAAVA